MTQSNGQIERDFTPVGFPGCVARSARALFFGGSFDPVHLGHVELTLAAARAWGGDGAWAVFVPAARSPHKTKGPAEDRHRVEMLRLGLRGRSNWWIWEQELLDADQNLGEPSYWADTWLIARSLLSGERAFLIGTDQALSMHRWHRYAEFWRDAVVMRRGDGSDDDFIAAMRATGAWSDAEIRHWSSRLIDVPIMDVSSTEIRGAMSAHENARSDHPVKGLDPGVFRYISERGLYRGVDD